MRSLLHFFIDNKKFTIILSLGIILYGFQALYRMNSESYPRVDFAIAIVTTVYPGASAYDVETKITKPLEDEIRTVSGIKDVRSISQAGLSKIVVRSDIDNADTTVVMNDLQKAVDRARGLPTSLEDRPLIEEIKSDEFPIISIALTGPNENRERDIIAETLKEKIEENKNIKSVRILGYYEREFTILLNHKKMIQHHIGVNEVIKNIKNTNLNIPGGLVKNNERQLLLKTEGQIRSIEELKTLPIRSNFSGKNIFLEDIAHVQDGRRDIPIRTLYNGQEAILLILSKKAGADIITTTTDIQKRVQQMTQRLDKDYKVSFYRQESEMVARKLGILKTNALFGLLIVMSILFIFFPSNISLATSLSLPLALMGTLGIMHSLNVGLNSMTILALVIVLGMLVDNSVVISENSVRLLNKGLALKEAIITSISNLWFPITVTSLTTIGAFLPMLLTKGIMGQFIKWIPIIVTIALLIGLIEGFFLLPTRLMFFGKNRYQNQSSNRFQVLERIFEQFVLFCVQRRYSVCVSFILLVVFSCFLLVKVNKFILFPAEQVEMYTARAEMPLGSTLDFTYESMKQLSLDIKKILGDKASHVVARAGISQLRPDDPKTRDGDRFGMALIFVDEKTKNNVSHLKILQSLNTIKFSNYAKSVEFEPMVNGPPVGNDIEGTFISNNRKNLEHVVEIIKKRIGVC